MQESQERYVPPELILIGEASEVIRGVGGVGFDMRIEVIDQPFEFESDEPDPYS